MNSTLIHTIPGLLSRSNVTVGQREEMYALLSRHFDGVSWDQFEHDLAEKNWIVEIRREGRLLGFSTLLVKGLEFEGRSIAAIYSGDTIVAPEAWGSPTLARTWIHSVNSLRSEFCERPCYWLLLTSGFRTYRFLPVFWRQFFPRYDALTPVCSQRLLNYLASVQYGSCFDPTAGLVRFPRPQKLAGSFGALPPGRRNDPHVAFFNSRNPDFAAGDELVCLTEISDANLTGAGRRMVASNPE